MNAVIDPKEFDAAQAAAAKAAAAADPYTYTHKLQKPLDYEGLSLIHISEPTRR